MNSSWQTAWGFKKPAANREVWPNLSIVRFVIDFGKEVTMLLMAPVQSLSVSVWMVDSEESLRWKVSSFDI